MPVRRFSIVTTEILVALESKFDIEFVDETPFFRYCCLEFENVLRLETQALNFCHDLLEAVFGQSLFNVVWLAHK